MQHALATNQTPFALLRPLNGIPVLVRVLAAGDKQMLVPATAEDLKRHGQITITPKTEDAKDDEQKSEVKEGKAADGRENGSTVQIRIPVVATVIQRCDKDGAMCMDIESPGPGEDGITNDNSYMYTTTTSVQNQQDGNFFFFLLLYISCSVFPCQFLIRKKLTALLSERFIGTEKMVVCYIFCKRVTFLLVTSARGFLKLFATAGRILLM